MGGLFLCIDREGKDLNVSVWCASANAFTCGVYLLAELDICVLYFTSLYTWIL